MGKILARVEERDPFFMELFFKGCLCQQRDVLNEDEKAKRFEMRGPNGSIAVRETTSGLHRKAEKWTPLFNSFEYLRLFTTLYEQRTHLRARCIRIAEDVNQSQVFKGTV
jgi:hypothetical protein